jgi:transcriptional regulator GlxA family with amidase domain
MVSNVAHSIHELSMDEEKQFLLSAITEKARPRIAVRGICSKVDVLGSRGLKASLKKAAANWTNFWTFKARERYVEFESESIGKLLSGMECALAGVSCYALAAAIVP